MAAHKYRIGEQVFYHSARRAVDSALCTVIRLLPDDGGERTYRIKSLAANVERIAKERELTGSA